MESRWPVEVVVDEAISWSVDDGGGLRVFGVPEFGDEVTTVLGTRVQPVDTPLLAQFAAGRWSYVRAG